MEVPRHVAIIMDGNGRWAAARGKPRYRGHQVGAESARDVIRRAGELSIEVLTLFTLSEDNLSRSHEEISSIMALLNRYLVKERDELRRNNVRLQTIGNLASLPPHIQRLLEETRLFLQGGDGLILNVALNYLGRSEITHACRNIAQRIERGELHSRDISSRLIDDSLQTAGLPDPDLLIRTGGEQRVSNFLLWQLAYTEFYFTDEMWPQFREGSFMRAIHAYQRRERRYGLERAASASRGACAL